MTLSRIHRRLYSDCSDIYLEGFLSHSLTSPPPPLPPPFYVSSLLSGDRVGVRLRRVGPGGPVLCPLSGGSDSMQESTLPALDSSFDSTLPAVCSTFRFGLSAGPAPGPGDRSGPGFSGLSLVRGCDMCGKRQRRMIDGDSFICKRCLCDIFPFNHISNNREFREVITDFSPTRGHLEKAKKMRFNPLDDELKQTLAGYNKTLGGCRYYEKSRFLKFRQEFLKNNSVRLSLLSLNINGLPKKRDELCTLMETFNCKFDIIGLTETHLNEVSAKHVTLEDYTLVSNSRAKQSWGGLPSIFGLTSPSNVGLILTSLRRVCWSQYLLR